MSVVLDRYGHLFPGHEAGVLSRLEAAYVAPAATGAKVIEMDAEAETTIRPH